MRRAEPLRPSAGPAPLVEPETGRDGAARPAWLRVAGAIATPQVLVAGILALGALSLIRPQRQVSGAPQGIIERSGAGQELTAQDVRVVMVDEAGLERNRSVRLALPPGASQRLAAVMTALRDELAQEGVWPSDLPAPRVFVETIDRRTVAVIDMLVPAGAAVSVAQELALLRSLTATAEANGAVDVRFLRGGEPTGTLLEHVAVPAAL